MTSEIGAKSYDIPKRVVYEAWFRVKKNKGSAGIDGVSIEEFEKNLSKNLYKLWNRMSSGSYFPQSVMRIEIPKSNGGSRPLGIPTVYDRIAQEVVRKELEQELEMHFVEDSFGFRPNKSAQEAVQLCRSRNFKYGWTIDLDISQYFDTIDHDLLMKAVKHHCNSKWMLMYIERWLKVKVSHPNGSEIQSSRGTPQGGVISPLLANLYLHYGFDKWISREYPSTKFERYADDIIIHCRSEQEAKEILQSVRDRFAEIGLSINQNKTQIVYCKDYYRREQNDANTKYDFLGFTFRARRLTQKDGRIISRFLPSASNKAKTKLRSKIRELVSNKTTHLDLTTLSRKLHPVIIGWNNYFKRFSTANDLSDVWWYLQQKITNWVMRKYRKNIRSASKWLKVLRISASWIFPHWKFAQSYDWTRRAV